MSRINWFCILVLLAPTLCYGSPPYEVVPINWSPVAGHGTSEFEMPFVTAELSPEFLGKIASLTERIADLERSLETRKVQEVTRSIHINFDKQGYVVIRLVHK